MIHIDQAKIEELLGRSAAASPEAFERILAKSRSLSRLTLEESAVLLATSDPARVEKIYEAATYVKNAIYGNRIVLFVPLYISNFCANNCLYCAFKSDNTLLERKALTLDEVALETKALLERGHKRMLMVAGEAAPGGKWGVEYYAEAIRTVYRTQAGPHRIKRVNINCAPLSVDQFKVLKDAGIGTYQIFQETYHDATYRRLHPKGPKSDPDNRIDAVDRAFAAGIDDVGIGVLYGLYDHRFDTLAMLMHVEHLEKKFDVGPHTISVPRLEPALGSDISVHSPYRVSDGEFKKVVSVLRLSVPYTGIILSTRESAAMRDELFALGISQVSAASRTSPGGYAAGDPDGEVSSQFTLSDDRSLDDVIAALIDKGLMPSFCAACYRKERTGEAFMNLARPGTIKGKCSMNALITLKEYLDDFASDKVKDSGYRLIAKASASLDSKSRAELAQFFTGIDKGVRDEYV